MKGIKKFRSRLTIMEMRKGRINPLLILLPFIIGPVCSNSVFHQTSKKNIDFLSYIFKSKRLKRIFIQKISEITELSEKKIESLFLEGITKLLNFLELEKSHYKDKKRLLRNFAKEMSKTFPIPKQNTFPIFTTLSLAMIIGKEHKSYYKILREKIEKSFSEEYQLPVSSVHFDMYLQVLCITSMATSVGANVTQARKAFNILLYPDKYKPKVKKIFAGNKKTPTKTLFHDFLSSISIHLDYLKSENRIDPRLRKINDFYSALKGEENIIVVDRVFLEAMGLERPYRFTRSTGQEIKVTSTPGRKMERWVKDYIRKIETVWNWKPIELTAIIWCGQKMINGNGNTRLYF